MRLTLDELIPRYQDRLYRAAYAVCRNPQEAEDAVQDVLLKYYRSGRDFESEEHLKAWLLRVTINRSRDLLRSFWRRNRESLEDYAETLPFQREEDGQVFRAVMGLPQRYRAAVFLYYYEGYSIRETGEILQAPENTVKSWLRRARALLKKDLEEDWEDDES